MERLTAEDALMLWPDQRWPQDIGALGLLDAAPLLNRDGRVHVEAVHDMVAARLHLVPRFRQLLCVPPPRLGGPLWVDAPAFDIADHVRTRSVPAPAGEAELLATVEQLRRQRLDRSRPLWEMWLVTGLPDQVLGLFVRLHHSIADGMAGVATMRTFLDSTPKVTDPCPPPRTPAAPPTARELRADHQRHNRAQLRTAVSGLLHPWRTVTRVREAWPALRELLAERPLPTTSLDLLVGSGRTLAVLRSDLGAVAQAATNCDATVNDVLLTITAGGIRALLRARGEPVDGVTVRIYVPVSLHPGAKTEARGNLIGQMVVPLPIGEANPLRRLGEIARETTRRKARVRPSLGVLPHDGLVGRLFLKLVVRQRVNVESADIPGPEVPLYFAGARLLEVFPMVQLIGSVSLAVGAMSYAGQFTIMLVADEEGYPDLDVCTAAMRADLGALTGSGRFSVGRH